MDMRRHPYRDAASRHERFRETTHEPPRQVCVNVAASPKNVHLAVQFRNVVLGCASERLVALQCDAGNAAVLV